MDMLLCVVISLLPSSHAWHRVLCSCCSICTAVTVDCRTAASLMNYGLIHGDQKGEVRGPHCNRGRKAARSLMVRVWQKGSCQAVA